MGTIPTIQLRLGAAGGPAFSAYPDGQVVAQGALGQDSVPFTDIVGIASGGIFITPYLFDVYEDGAPMVSGRTFQASHYVYSAKLSASSTAAGGPNNSITRLRQVVAPTPFASGTFSNCRINAPVVYYTDDNVWTCFYVDDTPPLVSAEAFFFRGRFRSLLGRGTVDGYGRGIGPSMIPLFIDDADLAGTTASTLGSSTNSWSLCTVQDIGEPGYAPPLGFTANRTQQGLSAVCDLRAFYDSIGPTIPNQSRMALGMIGGPVSPYVGAGVQAARGLSVDLATGRAMGNDNAAAWLRTYRRGDASATYDWPGWTRY